MTDLANGRPHQYASGKDAHRTHVHVPHAPICMADERPGGYVCTQPRGHVGRHSADGVHGLPYATWESADVPTGSAVGLEPRGEAPTSVATVTDRTDATDAEFEARLERLDRLEVADESAAERVARAMWDVDNPDLDWEDYEHLEADDYRRLASAAIAALKPPPPDGGDVR